MSFKELNLCEPLQKAIARQGYTKQTPIQLQSIPHLLEASPMILVLNGNNVSTSFAEWTTYPQVPLEIGADFSDLTTRSKAVALTYIVSINSVLYESVITCRSVQNYDS